MTIFNMKNVHLLPTTKPSKLYKQANKLKLRFIADSPVDSDISINQHICITNDEEIKEGDWYIDNLVSHWDNVGVLQMKCYCNKQQKIIQSTVGTTSPITVSKKIILTTDQELIANGVGQISEDELLKIIKDLNNA